MLHNFPTPQSILFLGITVSLIAITHAQDVTDKSRRKEDKWTQVSVMPKVVVARLSNDGSSIDVLEPTQNYVTEEVVYTVEVPVVEDGKTSTKTETRSRTITKCVTDVQRRNIKVDALSAFRIDGTQLSVAELGLRLKSPVHILFGNKPDAYARSVLKDDLTVIVENGPPSLTPTPKPSPTPLQTRVKP